MLDDHDIWFCIKSWASHPDFVLSFLARGLMDRRLLKVSISSGPIRTDKLKQIQREYSAELGISEEESE